MKMNNNNYKIFTMVIKNNKHNYKQIEIGDINNKLIRALLEIIILITKEEQNHKIILRLRLRLRLKFYHIRITININLRMNKIVNKELVQYKGNNNINKKTLQQ